MPSPSSSREDFLSSRGALRSPTRPGAASAARSQRVGPPQEMLRFSGAPRRRSSSSSRGPGRARRDFQESPKTFLKRAKSWINSLQCSAGFARGQRAPQTWERSGSCACILSAPTRVAKIMSSRPSRTGGCPLLALTQGRFNFVLQNWARSIVFRQSREKRVCTSAVPCCTALSSEVL